MIHTAKLCAVAYSVGKHVHIASNCMYWLISWGCMHQLFGKHPLLPFTGPVVATIPYGWVTYQA